MVGRRSVAVGVGGEEVGGGLTMMMMRKEGGGGGGGTGSVRFGKPFLGFLLVLFFFSI